MGAPEQAREKISAATPIWAQNDIESVQNMNSLNELHSLLFL